MSVVLVKPGRTLLLLHDKLLFDHCRPSDSAAHVYRLDFIVQVANLQVFVKSNDPKADSIAVWNHLHLD